MNMTSKATRWAAIAPAWVRFVLYAALGFGVACAAARAIAPTLDGIAEFHLTPNWGLLALVGVGCLAYRMANAAVWGRVLTAVGARVELRQAIRMWLLSEACRWLPGSLWNLGSRVVLGGRIGIPASVLGGGLALEFVLTVGSWCLIGVAGFIWYEMSFPFPCEVSTAVTLGMSLLAVAGFFGLIPAIRRRLASKIGGLAARFQALGQLRFKRAIACEAFVSYSALSLLQGAICWLLICALAPEHKVSLVAVVGANALAWLAGFVAVFAPAGLGVREGTFVLLLSPFIPWETCVAIATIWRVFQIGAEIACLGLQATFSKLGAM